MRGEREPPITACLVVVLTLCLSMASEPCARAPTRATGGRSTGATSPTHHIKERCRPSTLVLLSRVIGHEAILLRRAGDHARVKRTKCESKVWALSLTTSLLALADLGPNVTSRRCRKAEADTSTLVCTEDGLGRRRRRPESLHDLHASQRNRPFPEAALKSADTA